MGGRQPSRRDEAAESPVVTRKRFDSFCRHPFQDVGVGLDRPRCDLYPGFLRTFGIGFCITPIVREDREIVDHVPEIVGAEQTLLRTLFQCYR